MQLSMHQILIQSYNIYKIQNSTDPMRQIIRYEQQLRIVSQRIEVMILDDNPAQMDNIRDQIAEEQQLLKYLEVQSTKLLPQSKRIYLNNLARYKRKAKEHRDYIGSMYGSRALPAKSQQALFMEYQNQNAALAQNKMTMYQNQRVQEGMGRQLYEQGQKLYGGIEQNRQIRKEAATAEGNIHLIQMSIMKRKLMFGSLIALFVLILIIVIIMKARKK